MAESISLDLDPAHRKFLREALDTYLSGVQSDLDHPGEHPNRERAEGEADAYRRLIAALDSGSVVPGDGLIRTVKELREQTDDTDEYERVALQHDAFTNLLTRLEGGEVGAA